MLTLNFLSYANVKNIILLELMFYNKGEQVYSLD